MKRVVGKGDRAGARGFTLLEILVVLALIAFATTLAAMAFTGGMEGMRLRSNAKEIAAQLRYARAQAIVTGIPQRFTIDPAGHTWRGAKQRNGDIPKSLRVEFTGAREAGVRAGEGGILFFADGASTGGRIQLQVKRAAWRIDVGWLTGEVKLARVKTEALQ
ncbi:MAG TPA: GspH/FimT family pseudopilin [Pseudoxanthomonas sp.]|nr:GspH/FimT family pseudopilin [Pseudoxanthomonas sp.]